MKSQSPILRPVSSKSPRIAVLVPCYNEEMTVASVVRSFQEALPEAEIYVYDNRSTDKTAQKAKDAGAIVREELQQGKGHVVRRMFRDVEADFYVMVDGDDTYDASVAPAMIQLAQAGPIDLVNCIRKEVEAHAYREGHRWGNRALTGAVRSIFGARVQDMLSGYKVFSRRFAKSFPALSQGFDIETELTVHALELSLPVAHVEGLYRGRPMGSESKLKTYRDGWRILRTIGRLVRHERPRFFYGVLAKILALMSVLLAAPLLVTYLQTGLVPRLPTALLSTGIMVIAGLCVVVGLILDTVTRGRREMRLLSYLQYPAFDPREARK